VIWLILRLLFWFSERFFHNTADYKQGEFEVESRRHFLKKTVAFAGGGISLSAARSRGQDSVDVHGAQPIITVPVAVVQFDTVSGQVDRNVREMERLTQSAARSGARWILFHELATCDYVNKADEVAERVPEGPTTQRMAELSKRYDCFIAWGMAEVHHNRIYDVLVFVGPRGYVYHYRKTWIWLERIDTGFRNEWARYDPGTGPEIFEIDGVRATCFICSDERSGRCITELVALRPEVVFHPVNRHTRPSVDEFAKIARRIGAPMLVANRVGRSVVFDCWGCSAVISGQGEILAQANCDGREEVLRYDLKIPRV
jgi:predicted amidohydrolase